MVGLADERCIEIGADSLPLYAGVQLAVDTTLVCTQCRDESAWHGLYGYAST